MLVTEYFSESLKRRSVIMVEVKGPDGEVIEVVKIQNKITTVGLNMLRDILEGIIADGEIKYCAYGNDNTAVSAAHTTLIVEKGRKAVTAKAAGAAGIGTCTSYISPAEWVAFDIEELGWFAGVGATAAVDSGIMVGRILYSRTKTTLESLNIVRTDTITET